MAGLLVVVAALAAVAPVAGGAGPLIGVYPSLGRAVRPEESAEYYKSYQDWVEAFGATTVVLPLSGDADWYLNRLSGLLLPGGPTVPVPAFAQELVGRAIEANQHGAYFPVWGTCLGFEWLVETVGGLDALEIGAFSAVDLPNTIEFTAEFRDRVWRSANSTMKRWLTTQRITYESHQDGIRPANFAANPKLSGLFTVLATAADRDGQRYVAAVEGKSPHMPIYGVQFHPEKIRNQNNSVHPWLPGVSTHIPKTEEAFDGADLLARFFVGEASKSRHAPLGIEAEVMYT